MGNEIWAGDAGMRGARGRNARRGASFSDALVAHGNPFPCGHLHNVAIVTPSGLPIANRDPRIKGTHSITTWVNSTLIKHWQNKTHLITYLT